MENKNLAPHEPVVREGGPTPSNATAEPSAAFTPGPWGRGERANVPTTISDGDSIEAVFLILEDWSCEDLSVAEAYAKIIDALSAPVSHPGMDREAVAWAWLAANINMELSWGEDADEIEGEPCVWRVHRCSGGRNDREWDLIATGSTPLEAVSKAIALQKGSEPADGSQVEPSTTGTGRHNPLEPPPFIQWNGGENPAPGKVVEYKLRQGGGGASEADDLIWQHDPRPAFSGFDIIAYRIIPTDDQGGEG